jgi:hypothetical protein
MVNATHWLCVGGAILCFRYGLEEQPACTEKSRGKRRAKTPGNA